MEYFYKAGGQRVTFPLKVHFLYDRTQTLFKSEDIHPIRAIGTPKIGLDFNQLCDERAQQILNVARNEGKKLFVLWSGGIDSTVALTALLKFAKSEELVIAMNDESISEYALFYQNYIHSKLETVRVNFGMFTEEVGPLVDTHIVVTGELGDQIFGSDQLAMYGHTKPLAFLEEPWVRFANGDPEVALKIYGNIVGACPRDIETVKDFWWWINYALKYQCVAMRSIADIDNAVLEKNVFHFFDSDPFNDWAVSTPAHVKYPGFIFSNYKRPAKQYIYDFTKDKEYLDKKLKVASLGADLCCHADKVDTNWVRHK